MRKLVLFGALVATALTVIAFSCTPDISQTPSASVVQALFDPSASPPIVPTPTDLVFNRATRTLNIPIDPNAKDAEKEFLGYLNTLDGYPADTPGRVSFSGALNPASVTSANVRVMDFAANFTPVTGATISYSATPSSQIVISPPPTGWQNGKMFAVALIGGANGLKGSAGEPVVGSSVWAFARLNTSLVTCTRLFEPDGSVNPECHATTELIPSSERDPAARIKDQAAKAVQLEQLRLLYKPTLDFLESQGVSRSDVALVWTFTVTVRPILTFDPSNNIIPFPNDVVRSPSTNLVSLPIPDGGSPLQQTLYAGLNTLDGFSTTAPIISENSDPLGALNQGKIDPTTLTSSTGFLRLTSADAGHPATVPSVKACLDLDCRTCTDPACTPSLLPDGGTPNNPQQLQFVPNVPLDERTRYGVFISTNLKDTSGRNVIPSTTFALARLANPLVEGGRSTVSVLSDAQALQLEALRVGLKPFIDSLVAATPLQLTRSRIALAWAFTTQTEVSALKLLQGFPNSLPPATALPFFIADRTTALRPPPPIPSANIQYIFIGEISAAVLLTGVGGTLNPAAPSIRKILLIFTIPITAPPSGGYPVTIFGHGLGRARTDMLALADTLAAAGHVTIATDVMWHGDRTSCIGSRAALSTTTDDAACAAPLSQMCDQTTGRCVARDRTSAGLTPCTFSSPSADLACIDTGQGVCLSDNKCEGGDFRRDVTTGLPVISGWNLISFTNLFATRDNLRQQVVDLSQLTRIIKGSDATPGSLNLQLSAAIGATLNGDKVNYAGQSLGGILGTLYTSVATDVHRVVVNVPGGDPVNILSTSPSFAAQKAAFLATLASQGIAQGSPAFDFFIGIAKWILDPADPQNMSFSLKNGAGLPNDRAAFVQYITRDQTVPNPTTVELINAANLRTTLTPPATSPLDVFLFDPSDGALPPGSRHGFLLNFADITSTRKAQCQVANYLNTGVIPSAVTCPP